MEPTADNSLLIARRRYTSLRLFSLLMDIPWLTEPLPFTHCVFYIFCHRGHGSGMASLRGQMGRQNYFLLLARVVVLARVEAAERSRFSFPRYGSETANIVDVLWKIYITPLHEHC